MLNSPTVNRSGAESPRGLVTRVAAAGLAMTGSSVAMIALVASTLGSA